MKDAVRWRNESDHLHGIETLLKEDIALVDPSQVLALAPIAIPSSSTQTPAPVQVIESPPRP
jgi:hypothetical protein